jgi:predicted enzyme related to lactoylglutathione lyase
VVADVPGTVAFYERVFGAVRVAETQINDVPLVRLDLHGTDLMVSGEIIPGLQTHYGVVADNFEDALAELKARGVRFISEPLSIGTRRLAIVTDSNGQQVGIATHD